MNISGVQNYKNSVSFGSLLPYLGAMGTFPVSGNNGNEFKELYTKVNEESGKEKLFIDRSETTGDIFITKANGDEISRGATALEALYLADEYLTKGKNLDVKA